MRTFGLGHNPLALLMSCVRSADLNAPELLLNSSDSFNSPLETCSDSVRPFPPAQPPTPLMQAERVGKQSVLLDGTKVQERNAGARDSAPHAYFRSSFWRSPASAGQ